MTRLGVLVSGRGSNLAAILRACRDGDLPAEVAMVASNKPGCLALEVAREADVPLVQVRAMRFEQLFRQGPAQLGHLVLEALLTEEVAHQREAVGVEPAAGQPPSASPAEMWMGSTRSAFSTMPTTNPATS